MINALKFVQGAVAKKDYQPALTHFRIGAGRVLGYNGTIALSSPIGLEINAMPRAWEFVRAIERCTAETTVVYLTPGGKLALQSGRFRAHIECHQDSEILDGIVPEGVEVSFGGSVLAAFSALEPFIGTDASRPWAMGILLRGYSAYATNNIILAEYWIGLPLPEVNIPAIAVAELLRIGEEPVRVTMSDRSITFFYTNDRWMRAQLLSPEWPNIDSLLDAIGTGNMIALPGGFYDAIDTLAPFVGDEGRIYFRKGVVTTSPHEGDGASLELNGLPDTGAFHHKQLLLLQGRVEIIDFTTHPKPCPFQGSQLRGVILGMIDT